MRIITRVFDLARKCGYTSDRELADAMDVSDGQITRVRNGQRRVHQDFILGALRAFPSKTFDDLFEIVADEPGVATAAA